MSSLVLKVTLGIWLTAVIIAALTFPIVPAPERWFEFPIIPGLEDKARILFFHVPMSWTAVIAFMISVVYAVRYIVRRNPDDDLKAASSAGLGLLFCFLATVTGSVWAKFNWGSFWNWDPRETSIFVLLLIYGAYFALRSAVGLEEQRALLSSVYAVIAGATAPFFVFIMPRIASSLHPEPIVNAQGKIHMNPSMLAVFLCSLAGFTGLYAWMMALRVRAARLEASDEGGNG